LNWHYGCSVALDLTACERSLVVGTVAANKKQKPSQYGNSRPGYGIAQKNDLSTE
jgi:hypothetical protein